MLPLSPLHFTSLAVSSAVAVASLVILLLVRAVRVVAFLLFHVTEVPCQCEVHAAASAFVHLVACKGVAACEVFPLTAVEHVAAVE